MPEQERNAENSYQPNDTPTASGSGNGLRGDDHQTHLELSAEPDIAVSVREQASTREADPVEIDAVEPQGAGGAVTLFDLASHDEASHHHTVPPREPITTMQLLREPMLAIIAVLALGAAGWNYLKLNEARIALAAAGAEVERARSEKVDATVAKLSTEKTLAAAQIELTKLEKTIGDIKAALAGAGVSATAAGTAAAKTVEESAAGGGTVKQSGEQEKTDAKAQ